MAGRELEVDMGDDDLVPAWSTVIEVAGVLDTGKLTLIGGLMVYVHARRAGLSFIRSTNDADFLVDYVADPSALAALRPALASLGFELTDQTHAYRFAHADGRKIDVLVADHIPTRLGTPRLARRPALEAPGGAQAIRRADAYTLRFRDAAVQVAVPDELGALIGKAAAYQVDSRARDRHLGDVASILASTADARALDAFDLSRNDRRRLRLVADALGDPGATYWGRLSDAERGLGHRQLTRLVRLAGI